MSTHVIPCVTTWPISPQAEHQKFETHYCLLTAACICSQGMAVWSGNDDSCHQERHECGAMGVISVTANIVPGLMSQMMKVRCHALIYSMILGTRN